MTSWLRTYHTKDRRPPLGPIIKVSDAPTNEYQWINFDMYVDPGLYKLEVVSNSADFLNYFAAGFVDTPLQPEPIHPNKRFGEAYGIVANVIIPPGEGFGRSGGNFPNGFDLTKLLFRINRDDECLRIECWVKHPSKPNHTPLPPNFGYFPQLWVRQRGRERHLATSAGIARTPTLETTFPAVSRMTVEGETLVFGSEDGEDTDFNDLIVRLSRIGG